MRMQSWWNDGKQVFSLIGHAVFKNVDFTNTWKNAPDSSIEFKLGSISLVVTHSPGHAQGHVTFHGHGVYHAEVTVHQWNGKRFGLPE